MGMVENMRFGDLHPSIVNRFFGGVCLLAFLGVFVCGYAARASGLL